MTKDQLIATIMNDVRGQSAATQDSGKMIHPQDVEFQIAMAYEKVVIDFFNIPENTVNYDLDYFCKPFELTVKEDSAKNLYVDLPAQPVALNKAQGIRIVRPKDSNKQLVRVSEAEWISIYELEAFNLSPWAFCYIDFYNKKIMLQGNRPEYRLMDKIVVKMIPKLTELADSDEINSPAGDYVLTNLVMQVLGLRPTDNTNDGGR